MKTRFVRQLPTIAVSALVLTIGLVGSVDAQSTFERRTFASTVDSLANAFLVDGPVAGLAIAVEKDGEVILAKGYGLAEIEHNVPVTVETVFRIGSISKQFAAVAILQLVEQGAVRLDDPITKFIPDYPTQGHHITVHHLLTHTSGIKSYTGMGEAFWEKSRLDLSHEEMIDLFGNEPFDFAPGEKWLYNNSGFYLLGVIVEKARQTLVASASPAGGPDRARNGVMTANAETMYSAAWSAPRIESRQVESRPVVPGQRPAPQAEPDQRQAPQAEPRQVPPDMSLSDYLEENLFEPIGMTSSSYCDETAIVPHRAEGYEREAGKLVNDQPLSMNLPGAAGALCSTVMDMLRWQRALDNNTLISAESRAKMLTKAKLNDGSETGYGYGIGLGEFEGHRKVSHSGGINGFNTQHATYPDDNLIVTVFANTNGANPGQLEEQITRVALGIPLMVTLDLPTEGLDLSRYTGTYFFEEMGVRVTAEVREGQLWLTGPEIGEARLKYQGGQTFEMTVGQRIEFAIDQNPVKAVLRAGGLVLEGVREGS